MPQAVQAPARQPRQGGIKSVVPNFIEESRLVVSMGAGGLAWEDATCGFASLTRAGCFAPADDTNEVQRLTITGAPTGGAFRLTYDGEQTANINVVGLTAAAIQTELEALAHVDPGDITVTGSGLGPYTFTFGGGDSGTNVSQMTVTNTFTGGTTPSAAITTITAGVASPAKTGGGVNQYTTIGDPFAQYKGIECWIGGDNEGPSYRDQARAALEAVEEYEIEAALVDWAEGGSALPTQASVVAALGFIENSADSAYTGRPTIIMSRNNATAAAAAGAIKPQPDGSLLTVLGSPVIATSAATDGTISATGAIAVYASAAAAYGEPDLSDNTFLAIAERVYAIGVDCDYRSHVTITPPTP